MGVRFRTGDYMVKGTHVLLQTTAGCLETEYSKREETAISVSPMSEESWEAPFNHLHGLRWRVQETDVVLWAGEASRTQHSGIRQLVLFLILFNLHSSPVMWGPLWSLLQLQEDMKEIKQM